MAGGSLPTVGTKVADTGLTCGDVHMFRKSRLFRLASCLSRAQFGSGLHLSLPIASFDLQGNLADLSLRASVSPHVINVSAPRPG